MLREWCKFRYGVFPESGLADGGDRLYPHLYQEGNATLVNAGCNRVEETDDAESPFCPLGELYNRRAPTKQNLLCKEMSALESILNHEDFKNDSNSTVLSQVKFQYFTTTSPGQRYTIVLDRSSGAMGANGRWRNVLRSLRRFLRWQVPVGARVALVTFGSRDANMDLPPTVVTDSNREGLAGRVPRRVLQSTSSSSSSVESEDPDSCVYCAMNLALQALHEADGDGSGAIILVTGSPRRPRLAQQLLHRIRNASASVFPVAYPATAHSGLFEFGEFGKRYSIPEKEASASLTEVFLDVLRQTEGLPIQKVHESKLEQTRDFTGTFTLEENMLHRLSVTLSVEDEEEVEFFEVTDPSGRKHLFSKFEDGMVVFEHPRGKMAETGIWSYHAGLYPGGVKAMSVDVVSQGVGGDSQPYVLDAFTSADSNGGIVDAYETPIVIYARLTKGENTPVLRASVKARVYRPGVDGPIDVVLRDDGNGEPDLTAGDGIYSAYFTDIARVPGFYSLRVSADNNQGLAMTVSGDEADFEVDATTSGHSCCGSEISHPDPVPSAPFWRRAAGSGFFVRQGLGAGVDVAPPGRILDLRVSRIVPDSLFVHLSWTAPGGDYDHGKGKFINYKSIAFFFLLDRRRR